MSFVFGEVVLQPRRARTEKPLSGSQFLKSYKKMANVERFYGTKRVCVSTLSLKWKKTIDIVCKELNLCNSLFGSHGDASLLTEAGGSFCNFMKDAIKSASKKLTHPELCDFLCSLGFAKHGNCWKECNKKLVACGGHFSEDYILNCTLCNLLKKIKNVPALCGCAEDEKSKITQEWLDYMSMFCDLRQIKDGPNDTCSLYYGTSAQQAWKLVGGDGLQKLDRLCIKDSRDFGTSRDFYVTRNFWQAVNYALVKTDQPVVVSYFDFTSHQSMQGFIAEGKMWQQLTAASRKRLCLKSMQRKPPYDFVEGRVAGWSQEEYKWIEIPHSNQICVKTSSAIQLLQKGARMKLYY